MAFWPRPRPRPRAAPAIIKPTKFLIIKIPPVTKRKKKGAYHTLQRFMPLNAVKIRKNTMQRRTLYTQEKRKNKYQHVKKPSNPSRGLAAWKENWKEKGEKTGKEKYQTIVTLRN